MIARNITMRLKADSVAEFRRILETEVLPLLRKQAGFQDDISFISTSGGHAVGISFWDTQEHAEGYTQTSYPEALKSLAGVLEGSPQVHNWQMATSKERTTWLRSLSGVEAQVNVGTTLSGVGT
jgi:heme-degrading monooxygenase HmoA